MYLGSVLFLLTWLVVFTPVLSNIEFLAAPQNVAVLIGQDVVLNCLAEDTNQTGTLLYKWHFEGELVDPKTSVFANNSLFIPRIQRADLGRYSCNVSRADNQDSDSRTAVVIETYTEDFLTDPQSVESPAGRSVELTCITGRSAPNPGAFWEKDGVRFHGGVQDSASYGNFDSLGLSLQFSLKLEIVADASLTGIYRCVFENLLSQVTKKSQAAVLTIKVPDLGPSFEVSPPAEVFPAEGQPFSVDCVISGVPPPEVFWIQDGFQIINDERVFVASNGTLVFHAVSLSDKGVYLCQGRNNNGSVSSGFMTLHVPRLGLEFRQHPVDVHAIAGQTARLLCSPPESDPLAEVTWYKGSTPYQTRTGEFASSIDRSSPGKWDLVFSNVQQGDSGDYLCVASNPYTVPRSRTSRVGHLSVTGGALFLEPPIGQDLIKGELLQLKCVVEGDPIPVITWYKDGEPLRLTDRVSLVNKRQELYLTGVTKPDEGTYLCNVRNDFNNISASAFVRVRVPPAILTQIGHVTVNVGTVSEFSLPCDVSGDPYPTVTWLHNGGEITYSDRKQFIDGRLHIQEVSLEDSGSYSCMARNSAGSKTDTGTVQVIAPPVFISQPVSQGVTLGEGVTLRCEVTGQPKPSIYWIFNDTLPLPVSHIVSSDRTVVTIETMRWEDAGKYICIANNTAGQREAMAVLSVQSVPVITAVTGLTVYPTRSDLQLLCEATGVPSPSIHWLFQGQEVTVSLNGRITFPASNKLLIKFATESNTGSYTCVASNSAGEVLMRKQVTIYGPPVPPVLESVNPVSTTSLNITWSPREQAPFADVTSYIIQYKKSSAVQYVLFRDDIPQALTYLELDELQPNTNYVVKMSAKNSAGEGSESSVRAGQTFESAPTTPRYLKILETGSDSVSLSWEIPKVTNGEIRLYQITVRETTDTIGESIKSIVLTNPSLPLQEFTLERLHPHTTYIIKVRAATDLDNEAPVWGDYTEPLEVTTFYTAPTGSPQNVTMTSVTPRSFTITWKPVAMEETNGPITNYEVKYMSADQQTNQSELVDVSQNEVTVTVNVLPWQLYDVTVTAVNEGGKGPESDTLRLRTEAEAPSGVPQDVRSVILSREAILVEWKHVPIGERNGPISGYVVKYGVKEETLRLDINISSPDTLSTVLGNVLSFTVYEVSVAAFTFEVSPGQGPYSSAVQILTSQSAPGPVTVMSRLTSPDEISLTWLLPLVNAGVIKQYIVRYRAVENSDFSDWIELTSPPNQTFIVLKDLSSDTTYQINITTENGAGEGEITQLSAKTSPPGKEIPPNLPVRQPDLVGSPSMPPSSIPSKHLPAIVAGSLTGALVLFFILGLVVYKCCKKRCEKTEERYYLSKVEDDVDSISDINIKSSDSESAPPSPPPPSLPPPSIVVESVETPSAAGIQITIQPVDSNDKTSSNQHTGIMPGSTKDKKLSGVVNAGFVDATLGTREGSFRLPADQVYSKVDKSRKKQYRMRAESAAAIAVERNRGIQVLTGDKDSLINNEAEIVYDERTAL